MQIDTRCPGINGQYDGLEASGSDPLAIGMTAGKARSLFMQTSQLNIPTPLTQAFFSPANVAFILGQIETSLNILTEEEIRIAPNEEFIQTMVDVASRNLGLSHTNDTVALLNRAVVEHETRVQFFSLRQRKLFYKYFWYQDRMKVFPYGEGTKAMSGEVTVSPSGYMLSNPHKRWQAGFLRDTEGLTAMGLTPADGWCSDPGYLQPKAKRIRNPA